MKKSIILNHHAASLLAYYVDPKKGLHFILEQKDPGYKPPYFDNGLNFIGGNWKKGVNEDKSPEELVRREINEEFWDKYEAPESLNELLGEKFLKREPGVIVKYNNESVQRIKSVGKILDEGASYTTDYIVKISPSITKNTYGLTAFTNQLSKGEFETIETIIDEFKGKLITDNIKWGSKIVSVTLDEINEDNKKFAWGYGRILNDLIKSYINPSSVGVIRPLKRELIKVKKINYPDKTRRIVCPSFNDFERRGYVYKTS
ncbi:MAG: hypothetical protein KKA61_01570 [Nanoarchaeota archaeon]|nr:hypothetical protein [Nanoarchaeota archaeon]